MWRRRRRPRARLPRPPSCTRRARPGPSSWPPRAPSSPPRAPSCGSAGPRRAAPSCARASQGVLRAPARARAGAAGAGRAGVVSHAATSPGQARARGLEDARSRSALRKRCFGSSADHTTCLWPRAAFAQARAAQPAATQVLHGLQQGPTGRLCAGRGTQGGACGVRRGGHGGRARGGRPAAGQCAAGGRPAAGRREPAARGE